jgi:hypothetical protein
VRKVFASLWTDRAFVTRDYYRIDHLKVQMGILVHPSFVDEKANGVLLISEGQDGAYDIQVSCQIEDISITNPIVRGASPEHLSLRLLADGTFGPLTYLRRSSLIAGQVLSAEQLQTLAKQAAIVHQDQKRNLGELFTGKTDIEFILDAQGAVLIKQGRPLPNAAQSF